MKISELIEKLSQLPQEATIGKASFDEEDKLRGYNSIFIRKVDELEIEIGQKHLDYYFE